MKVIVNGLATEYLDEGNGPVVLMLHGWRDSLHTFDPIVTSLESAWRLVRLDLPGFGDSELPDGPWYIKDYAEFVQAFCTKLEIAPEVLVGHSLGGRIILKAVASHKIAPKKIVLIASAGIAKTSTGRNRMYGVTAKVGKVITYIPPLIFWRRKLREKLYRSAGSDYLDAGPLRQTFINIIREDLSTDASRIEIPTLLIWGAQDTETPVADGRKLNQLIKGSNLEIVDQAGHFVHHEDAQLVAGYLRSFLRS